EFQVAADLGNVAEDVFEIARHRNLFDGIGQFAVDNPHAGGAAGIISGDQVGAMPEKLGDIQAVFDLRNNLIRRFRPGLEEVISRTDSGRSGQSARRVGRGFQAQFFRGVGIQQIRLQDPVLHDYRAAGGNALAIERRGAETAGHGAVVDYGDVRSGNFLAEFAGEERGSAIDRVAVYAFEDM